MNAIYRFFKTLFRRRKLNKISSYSKSGVSKNNSRNLKKENFKHKEIDANNNSSLSNEILSDFFNKAFLLLEKKNYDEAINLTSELIKKCKGNSNLLTDLYDNRANIYSLKQDWIAAIKDIKKCIELNPDNDGNFLSMGVYLTFQLFYSGNYRIDEKNNVLKDAIYNYRECLSRNPTNLIAKLNITETYIFLMEWDDAIGYNGGFKSELKTNDDKLLWTILDALAAALGGEPIPDEDYSLLNDKTIKYDWHHDYKQLVNVLEELQRINYDNKKLKLAKDLFQLFLNRINNKN